MQSTGINSTKCPMFMTVLYKKSYPCPVLAARMETGTGNKIDAKVAKISSGRLRNLRNSYSIILSNPFTSRNFFEVILQCIIAKTGADDSYILHHKFFVGRPMSKEVS